MSIGSVEMPPGETDSTRATTAILAALMNAGSVEISTAYWFSLVMLIVTGAADTVSTVLRQTIRQLVTPNHLRGRMTSINMMFFMGGPQLGELRGVEDTLDGGAGAGGVLGRDARGEVQDECGDILTQTGDRMADRRRDDLRRGDRVHIGRRRQVGRADRVVKR